MPKVWPDLDSPRKKLCPISHNDLIMDWFSRANLYDLPHVTVSSFGSEIDSQETKVREIVTNFYGTPIRCSERELWIFSHDHLFEMKFRILKRPKFHKSYLRNYCEPSSEILWRFSLGFHLYALKISAS